MGMLATVMNALALQDALEKIHVTTRVQTAIHMTQIAEPYIPLRALRHLEKGRVVMFAAGLGVPYFSTDTTARAARARDRRARRSSRARRSTASTPPTRTWIPTAQRFETIEYLDVLREGYQVMDATAISLCMENELPIIVFDFRAGGEHPPGRVRRADRHPGPRRRPMTIESAPEGRPPRRWTRRSSVLKDELAGDPHRARDARRSCTRVVVDYYGTPVPIQQLASFSVPGAADSC